VVSSYRHHYDDVWVFPDWVGELDAELRNLVQQALIRRCSCVRADDDEALIESGTRDLEQIEAGLRGEEALRTATRALRKFNDAWQGVTTQDAREGDPS
jgi:hypothetical protein